MDTAFYVFTLESKDSSSTLLEGKHLFLAIYLYRPGDDGNIRMLPWLHFIRLLLGRLAQLTHDVNQKLAKPNLFVIHSHACWIT